MRALEGLSPERVFYYFEELCGIPHGSGNVEQISNYLASFAESHRLSFVQDNWKNVIIYKNATPGYEEEPTLILQGHMDMVAVQTPDCHKDLKKEGLSLRVDGDRICAVGTSLGGDDGIAVAYALALLEADSLAHPRLEVVITVDEEVGMDGARGIDPALLTGRRLLNLDSEEEGIFLTGCAGGMRLDASLPLTCEPFFGIPLQISIEGLLGGHSGTEIDKERGNANCLMGRLIRRLSKRLPLPIQRMEGGLADNAIPRQAMAVILMKPENESLVQAELAAAEAELRGELSGKDPDFHICVSAAAFSDSLKNAPVEAICTTPEATSLLASYLTALPNGVHGMSASLEGMVETSCNLGTLKFYAGKGPLTCGFSIRSSVESAKQALADKILAVTELSGGFARLSGDYPGWAYRLHSPLRDKMVSLYESMYGKKPLLTAIHAGLECGIFAGKLADLDCISFGPDIYNIHTTEESLSISSTARVWEFLLRLLAIKDADCGES